MKMIDFSRYETDAHSYSGSDDKRSIFMDGKYYMVKLPNDIASPNSLQTSMSNNVISEHVGSGIMRSLGLEAQNTVMGYWGDKIAVACEDFREEGWELHEFSWYMQNVIPKSLIGRIATYEQLYKVFDECRFLREIRRRCIESYWDMTVGDALIGNFDRHKDNFGYLTNKETGEIKPSPIYDCGSCLYPALTEERFEEILSSREEIEMRVYDFPKIALNRNRSKSKEDRFGYFELLSSGFDSEFTTAFFRIYPRIDMEKIFSLVDGTPFITDVRKDFYKKMLMYRKELILDRAAEILKG
ncbi:MAG: HipA domain-containing protein [Ruminococcus sp.]|nr:HipA domain-containing protein [Ruminococcus sp.]